MLLCLNKQDGTSTQTLGTVWMLHELEQLLHWCAEYSSLDNFLETCWKHTQCIQHEDEYQPWSLRISVQQTHSDQMVEVGSDAASCTTVFQAPYTIVFQVL